MKLRTGKQFKDQNLCCSKDVVALEFRVNFEGRPSGGIPSVDC